jgi:hypothetical protein
MSSTDKMAAFADEAARAVSARSTELLAAATAAMQPLLDAVRAENLLYVNPLATSSLSAAVLELDTMCLGLALLTVAHATLHRRLLSLVVYLLIGVAIEQTAIRVGGTHCHGEALLMVSQCSSANSCAMYVPALYACQLAVSRLPVHALARPFAAGLLLAAYAVPYSLQGGGQVWWAYAGSETSAIPLPAGPMWTLADGAATALSPSSESAAALAARIYGMPTIWPLIAAGLGVGVGVGSGVRSLVESLLTPRNKKWWLIFRVPLMAVAALLAAVSGIAAAVGAAALGPALALPSLLNLGVSQPVAVSALLMLMLAPVMLLPPSRVDEVRADLLLLAIPVWHHIYLATWPAWLNSGLAKGTLSPDVYLFVIVASVLSLSAHARATLFDVGADKKDKARALRPNTEAGAKARSGAQPAPPTTSTRGSRAPGPPPPGPPPGMGPPPGPPPKSRPEMGP